MPISNSGELDRTIEICKDFLNQHTQSAEKKEIVSILSEAYIAKGDANGLIAYAKQNSNLNLSISSEDSLQYLAAENLFTNNNCTQGIQTFTQYLKQFPNGAYKLPIYFYRAECYYSIDSLKWAQQDYQQIIDANYPSYVESSLKRVANISYNLLQDYNTALPIHQKLLNEYNHQPEYTYELLKQLTHIQYEVAAYEEVVNTTNVLLEHTLYNIADASNSLFYAAAGAYKLAAYEQSIDELSKITPFLKGAKAAQAIYLKASAYYQLKQYEQSLELCLSGKEKASNYNQWLVKLFILIADNYYAMDNLFQAKATLTSIANHYQGDSAILIDVNKKLDRITQQMQNESKVENPSAIDSTLNETK